MQSLIRCHSALGVVQKGSHEATEISLVLLHQSKAGCQLSHYLNDF